MKYARVHLMVHHQRAIDQILQQRFDNKYKKRAYISQSFFNHREKKGAHSKGSLFWGHNTTQVLLSAVRTYREGENIRKDGTPAALHKGIWNTAQMAKSKCRRNVMYNRCTMHSWRSTPRTAPAYRLEEQECVIRPVTQLASHLA